MNPGCINCTFYDQLEFRLLRLILADLINVFKTWTCNRKTNWLRCNKFSVTWTAQSVQNVQWQKNQQYKVSPSNELIMCKKTRWGNERRDWITELRWILQPAAVEEMVKKITVAYLKKNEQAASCLLERKWGDLTYPLWLMLKMLSDWSWDKIVI